MPKAAKSDTTRKHEQSPKKGRVGQTEAAGPSAAGTGTSAASTSHRGAPASNDPSQWRASTLKPSHNINKTDVKELYRLTKKEDLEGIPYRTQTTYVGDIERTTIIYRELDIERRAWEKHGGPDKFDAYLAKLKATYLKKNGPNARFKQPRTYKDQGP